MENKRINKKRLLLFMLLLTCSCSKDLDFSGLFQSRADADERFTRSTAQGWQRFPCTISLDTASYSILIAGDCHVGATGNLVKLLGKAKKPGISALFLAGDVSTGKEEDYRVLKETLEDSDSVQYYLVVGNHDLFYDGWKTFYADFGSSTYTVVINTVNASDLYIFLDTGGGTLGEKQLDWLKKILQEQRFLYRNCVIITHNNFFRSHITDSTNPLVEEIYALLEMFSVYQVNLVVTGHDHTRSEDALGVTTFVTLDGFSDGLSNASYLELDVKDGILRHRFMNP
jgi:3',5'-cyclic AMP phosphodiesterase CpdA